MLRIKDIKSGNVLKLTSPNGKSGYAIVLKLDKFGLLVQLSGGEDEKDREMNDIVYVNPYSARRWERSGNVDVIEVASHLPTFFTGASWGFWTIEYPEGSERIEGSETSHEALVGRGFVPKVLWDAGRIEAYFDGRPLTVLSIGL